MNRAEKILYAIEEALVSKANLAELKNLTSMNHHEEARLLLAKILKNTKLEKAYRSLNGLYKFYNSLTPQLQQIRADLDTMLFREAARKFPKQIQDITTAF